MESLKTGKKDFNQTQGVHLHGRIKSAPDREPHLQIIMEETVCGTGISKTVVLK